MIDTLRQTAQKGYTLLELLLYITMIGGLLTATSVFFARAVDSRVKNQSIAEVEQQGTLAIDTIARALRGAEAVTSPATGGVSGAAILDMPDASDDPTIFAVANGTLYIKEGADNYTPITNSKVNVSGLIFFDLSRSGTPGVVRFGFIMSRASQSGQNAYSYQKTFIGTASLRP